MVPLTNPDWIARFGARLSNLRPSMSAVTAAALAIEAHRHEPDSPPEQCAERFHADHLGASGTTVEARTVHWSTSMYDRMEHAHPQYQGDAGAPPS